MPENQARTPEPRDGATGYTTDPIAAGT
ncbi:MAG: hypothetical protein JWM13_255, partial [Arthrobacter sp.]|nr:hypothetical protein [Arthrobacter sp.]